MEGLQSFACAGHWACYDRCIPKCQLEARWRLVELRPKEIVDQSVQRDPWRLDLKMIASCGKLTRNAIGSFEHRVAGRRLRSVRGERENTFRAGPHIRRDFLDERAAVVEQEPARWIRRHSVIP